MTPKRIIAISDLHVGGNYKRQLGVPSMLGEPHKLTTFLQQLATYARTRRGTAEQIELVIHGDFIDFLAEPTNGDALLDGQADHAAGYDAWTPSEEGAIQKLDNVVRSYGYGTVPEEQDLFRSLAACIQAVHHTTILLGNHDVELAYPRLRQRLLELFQADCTKCSFGIHNEPFRIGELLIEHGDRYDPWNMIDHAGLRYVACTAARGEKLQAPYQPCLGSKFVCDVINPIKETYHFVDVLKPERPLVMELIQQLDSSWGTALTAVTHAGLGAMGKLLRDEVRGLLGFAPPTMEELLAGRAGLHFAAGTDASMDAFNKLIRELVSRDLPQEYYQEHLSLMDERYRAPIEAPGSLVQAGAKTGTAPEPGWYERRQTKRPQEPLAPARYKQIQRLLADKMGKCSEVSLRRDRDHDHRAISAAEQMMRALGVRVVIMGHTHLEKEVPISLSQGGLGVYANTGTWASRMFLDPALLSEDRLEDFKQLLDRLIGNRELLTSTPFFADVRLDDAGRVISDDQRAPPSVLRAYAEKDLFP